jgi:hypothetical protein
MKTTYEHPTPEMVFQEDTIFSEEDMEDIYMHNRFHHPYMHSRGWFRPKIRDSMVFFFFLLLSFIFFPI